MEVIGNDTTVNTTDPFDILESGSPLKTFTGTVPEWSKSTLYGFLTILFLIGVPGNVIVVITLLKIRQKTSTDWFIVFISLDDLLSLCVSCPLYLLVLNSSVWRQIGNNYICSVHLYVIHVAFLASNLLFLAIGIDRFIKTCKPHRRIISPRRAVIVCATITCFTMTACLPIALYSYNKRDNQCAFANGGVLKVVYLALLLVVITVSVILSYVYIRICLVLKNRIRVMPVTSNSIPISQSATVSGNGEKRQGIEPMPLKERLARKHAWVTSGTTTTPVDIHTGATPSGSDITLRVRDHDFTSKQPDNNKEGHVSTNVAPSSSREGECRTRTRNNNLMASKFERSACPSTQRAEKTTRIVAITTGVFALCTIIPVLSVVILLAVYSTDDTSAKIAMFFLLRLYIINNATNPIFFGLLSSRFRQKAREIFKC